MQKHHITDSDLLIRGLTAQLQRSTPNAVGSAAPVRRIDVRDIDVGGRQITVSHNVAERGLVIAGIAVDVDELDPVFRDQIVGAVAQFDAAQDAELVASARQTISALIRDLLIRRPDIDQAIRALTFVDSTTPAAG